jgi:competence protein ComEC
MRAHLALAGSVVGAWFVVGVPWWLGMAALIPAARWWRHPWGGPAALSLITFLLASTLATNAWASLDFPPVARFDGWVTLVDDPRPSGPVGVRVTVRFGERRLTATAVGPVAGRLDDALAGERVRLVGTVRPVSDNDGRSIARHVVGRISVDGFEGRVGAAPFARFANTIRRTLERGAESLDRTERPLFLGMVIGDDRAQSAVTADDFRAAGLGHLLVVSGQNVAFVLAVAMPVVGRFRPAGRALSLFLILGIFAMLTRFEPSVLRATAMAGVGIGSAALGRPVNGRAALSWACAGLLLIDPFLVRLVAFQLSAAATAGIVWLSVPLAERLPGPAWLRVPFATTAAAQLAVSPVLVSIFGPMPLASLPANLLAGPASGAVMIWGATGGLVAGFVGGRAAEVIHLPTRLLLWWVDQIAGRAALAPPATVGAGSLIVLGVLVGAAILWRRRRAVGVVAGIGTVLVLWSALAGAPSPRPGVLDVGNGVTVVQGTSGTVIVLDNPRSPRSVLEGVRASGARRPSLVIALDGDRADADAVVALRDRYGPMAIAAPPLHRVPGGRTVVVGQRIATGGVEILIEAVQPRLEVSFTVGSGNGSGNERGR